MTLLHRYYRWTLLWTLGGSGVLLLGTGLWATWTQIRVLQTWEPVAAVVLQSSRIGPAARFNTYTVSVRYTRVGQSRTAQEPRSWVAYAAQTAVTAYVDPHQPAEVRIHSILGFWGVPVVLSCGGGVLLAGAWTLLRQRRRH